MSPFRNILAVIQDKQEAHAILSKAKALAHANGAPAPVHVVRVIYEGVAELKTKQIEASNELKQFILVSEETYLQDTIDTCGVQVEGIESSTLWNQKSWEGVVHAAQKTDAELIIKASTENGGIAARIQTPDDWNLLRHAKVPVLLTGMNPWPARHTIVAAVDVFDENHNALNIRIARTAAAIATQVSSALHLVSTYPLLEPWATHFGAASSYVNLKAELDEDIFTRIGELAEAAGIDHYQSHSAEGPTVSAIRNTLSALSGTILVLGTKAREGVEGALFGNTAEKLLHEATTDVLTVP